MFTNEFQEKGCDSILDQDYFIKLGVFCIWIQLLSSFPSTMLAMLVQRGCRFVTL